MGQTQSSPGEERGGGACLALFCILGFGTCQAQHWQADTRGKEQSEGVESFEGHKPRDIQSHEMNERTQASCAD